MTATRSLPSLVTIAFWSTVTMGTVFCSVMLNDLLAQTVPAVTGEQASQSSESVSDDVLSLFALPIIEQIGEVSEETSTLSPIEQFLRGFEEQLPPAGDASILCCNLVAEDSCNVIGSGYSETQCVTEGGRVEPCIDYCGVPDAATLQAVNAVSSSSDESLSSSSEASSVFVQEELPVVDAIPEPETFLPVSEPEICGNTFDDDQDGFTDDQDTDCAGTLAVTEDGQLVNIDDLLVPVQEDVQPVSNDVFPVDTVTETVLDTTQQTTAEYEMQRASWWEMMKQFLGL